MVKRSVHHGVQLRDNDFSFFNLFLMDWFFIVNIVDLFVGLLSILIHIFLSLRKF